MIDDRTCICLFSCFLLLTRTEICEPVIHIACCHAILLGSEPLGKLCEQTCTGDASINGESIVILFFSLVCLYVGKTAE